MVAPVMIEPPPRFATDGVMAADEPGHQEGLTANLFMMQVWCDRQQLWARGTRYGIFWLVGTS